MASDDEQQPPRREDRQSGDRPDYKVYRSRPGLFRRLRAPDLSKLRQREKSSSKRGRPDKQEPVDRGGAASPPRGNRRWLKWVMIAMAGWVALSVFAFIVSATIQSFKFPGSAKDSLNGGRNMITGAETILVMGTDLREKGSNEPGAQTVGGPNCPNVADCVGKTRADSILLIRAGGGTFRKLSIPRDSFAEIPGHNAQKINAAYFFGGPGLEAKAVANFLGITIDHVIVVDFSGFKDLINAVGGVKVKINEKICSKINGGAGHGGSTLLLTRGERVLHGETALLYARTRENSCDPSYNDIQRAAAQQAVLSGIKNRLTDPLRLPYNFIHGPIIGWDAPRAIISDMGPLTMPQMLVASAIGGNSKPTVLKPSGAGPLDSLVISQAERHRAVQKFLHG
jgi:LCP family protein required for cell wall assembly